MLPLLRGQPCALTAILSAHVAPLPPLLPGRCRSHGRAIAELMQANDYRGFKLWRAVRMATRPAEDAVAAEAQDGQELYRCATMCGCR